MHIKSTLQFQRTALAVAVVLMMALLAAVPAWSQSQATSAQLSGTVLDENGASVPGAKVTLSNPDVNFAREATAGDNGLYTLTLIPPGKYELKVEKPGFNAFLQSNVVLAVGQSSTLDAKLQVGNVNQVVEVTASAPVLNTGSADLGSEVSGKQAVELPLNIRNVYGLVALDSSVNNSQQTQALNPPGSQGNADQDISFFNFGGGRFGTTAFLLDGAWDGAGDWDGVIYVPSVDELQEFRIQTNTFSPQYGLSMGNVVNAVTSRARVVSTEMRLSFCATTIWMRIISSTTGTGWRVRSSSATSLALRREARFIFRTSINSVRGPSSSEPMKGCASRRRRRL